MHTPTPHTATAHRPSHPPAGLLVALIAFASLITACASAVPAPTEHMAAAQAAVTSATSAGAADLAPSELRSARDKLTRAQVAVTAEQHELATRLARESQADANLAEVTARSTQARKTAGELGEGNRVLREELQRSAQ